MRSDLASGLLGLALLAGGPALASSEIDPASGLIRAPGWEQVQAHCSGCHSIRLVTQNHMNRDRWEHLVRWMQDNHGLWPLGEAEPVILDYLAQNYGVPELSPRRQNLQTRWLDAPEKE